MFIYNIKSLLNHVSIKKKIQLVFLLLFMIITSFVEVISLGSVIPFLSVLTNPDTLFSNKFLYPIFETLEISKAKDLLLPITVIFSIAAIVSSMMRLSLIWMQLRISFSIGLELSINIFNRTLHQPYEVHVSRNSSEIISAISQKINVVIGSTILPILIILSSSIMTLFILVTLIVIDVSVSLTSFVVLGLIYLIIIFFTKKILLSNSEKISINQNKVIKILQEGLGGIRDVLINGNQRKYSKIYENYDAPLRRALADNQIIAATPRFIIEGLGMVFIALIAYLITLSSSEISTAIPTLGALAFGAYKLLPVIQNAYMAYSNMRGAEIILNDIKNLLDQPVEIHKQQLLDKFKFNKNIELKNVYFTYKNEDQESLEAININIKKGEKIGIIGKTGSGKTTLANIFMGLLSPSRGALIVDDNKITSQNIFGWYRNIAFVPQDIFLLDGTIKDNITFGFSNTKFDYKEIEDAAIGAKIHSFVSSYKEKYDTFVGERGIRLSGGQRQRIGIARALFKKASFIVLDEATNALDAETESSVMESIESLSNDITVLIVAHRLSTLKSCDRIIELKDGKIVREGTYEQVVPGK